jgi:hypothetical protein
MPTKRKKRATKGHEQRGKRVLPLSYSRVLFALSFALVVFKIARKLFVVFFLRIYEPKYSFFSKVAAPLDFLFFFLFKVAAPF